MVKLNETEQRSRDYYYRLALHGINFLGGSLDVQLERLEGMMTEVEMAEDARYGALCGLYETLKETKETLTNNTGV